MRQFKDSGVDYIGQIPSDWTVTRLGYLCTKLDRIFPAEAIPLICSNHGEVVVRGEKNSGLISDDDSMYQGVKKGDLLIHGMDTWHGAIAVSELDGKCTTVVHVCDSEQNKDFIKYFLQQLAFLNVYKVISNGIRQNTSDFRSWEKAGSIRMAIPSLDEQNKIAFFLNKHCAEIDATVAKIREEIELLKRQKASLIYEYVSHGTLGEQITLFKEYSDNGWLGGIPNSWSLLKAKYLFAQRFEKGNKKNLQLLTPSQHFGVIPQTMLEELTSQVVVKVSEKTDLRSFKGIHPGDFCISLRSFQGGFEYCKYEGVVSSAYSVFYSTARVCNGYYRYLFKTKSFIERMNAYAMSLRDGKNIPFEDFASTYIPYPPLDEQRRIASFLDDGCAKIDEVIRKKEKQLETLDSYKKSLIYEYVTGKKEVA